MSIVVKFLAGVDQRQIDELLAGYGLRVHSRVGFVADTFRLEPVDPAAAIDAATMATRLQRERAVVQYAEPTRIDPTPPHPDRT